MGVWGLSPQWGPGAKPWSGGQGGKAPSSWKHFSILKLLVCCFPGLFQPNTQVLLAIQVHNHRSLNDAQIRGGRALLRGGGAELRWAPAYFHHWLPLRKLICEFVGCGVFLCTEWCSPCVRRGHCLKRPLLKKHWNTSSQTNIHVSGWWLVSIFICIYSYIYTMSRNKGSTIFLA